ncbi:hypothetical protein Lqui_2711 [Legionella quinlivanii]|uniref:Uncharacterized protein n=1 Tax=Legionella quinlivanii TaxID=45073 RepID=A0A0W0XKY9_9GAMM|nr:hypothetical protein [Legionella quinlivanii]KTD45240.1 hypothetical protein Lqui_2711 [Legionella quinlivanii]SEG04149.1 hypothetical protein SAMN02746093_01715 [Legionella quinlivanii DSM 21216]STY11460.1 ATPase involved in DNA repair [Legionella quinlivanii]
MKEKKEKVFVLVNLGTDTKYTPTPEEDPVSYPDGEALSVAGQLVDSNGVHRDDESPYVSDKIEVIIGPDTLGKAVYSRIARQMESLLKAILRGDDRAAILSHSRGGVETVLLTHYMNAIKNLFNQNKGSNYEQFITLLKADPVVGPFLANATITKKLQQEVFPQLKAVYEQKQTIDLKLSIFVLDPVPGDVPIYGWDDKLFYQPLPEIVDQAEIVYYENEMSWGFTPILPKAPVHEGAKFSAITIPGHHGTGSSGNNCDQTGTPVPAVPRKSGEGNANAKQAHKLVFLKLLRFLNDNQVQFDMNSFATAPEKGLLNRVIRSLNKHKLTDKDHPLLSTKQTEGEPIETVINSECLVPATYRSYYKIQNNELAYKVFNNTNYAWLGKRNKKYREALQDGKYVPLSTVIPPVSGFVNEEHANIAREKLFKDFGIDATSSIDHLLTQATLTLVSGFLAAIAKPDKELKATPVDLSVSSSMTESWTNLIPAEKPADMPSTVANLLATESGQKMIKEGFSAVVEKISQSYLSAGLDPATRWTLYQAIVGAFNQFEETLISLKKSEESQSSEPVPVGAVAANAAKAASSSAQNKHSELSKLLEEVKEDAKSSLVKTFAQYQQNLEHELQNIVATIETSKHDKLVNGFKKIAFSIVKKNADTKEINSEEDKRFFAALEEHVSGVKDSDYPETIALLWPLIKGDIIAIYGLSGENAEAINSIDSELLSKYFDTEPSWSDFELLFEKLINFQRDLKAVEILPTDEYLHELQLNLNALCDCAARHLPAPGDASEFAKQVRCFRILAGIDEFPSIEKIKGEYHLLEETLAELLLKNENMAEINERLSQARIHAEEQVKALESKNAASLLLMQALTAQIDDFQLKTASLQNQLEARTQEKEGLTVENADLQKTVESLRQEIAVYTKKIDVLSSEKEKLDVQNKELLSTLSKFKGMKEHIQALLADNERLQASNEKLQDQVAVLKREKSEAVAQQFEMVMEAQAKDRQLSAAVNENLELKSQLGVITKTRNELDEQNQSLAEENAKLRAEIEAKSHAMDETRRLQQAAAREIEALKSENSDLHNQSAHAKESAERQIAQLSAENSRLAAELNQAAEQNEANRNEIGRLEIAKTALEEELVRARASQSLEDEAKRAELLKDLNSDTQRKCLNTIHDELLPLIDEYLEHLKNKKDPIAEQKKQIVTNLRAILNDDIGTPLAVDRMKKYQAQLTKENKEMLSSHRDGPWTRFASNSLKILAIALTGVLPGLAVLGAYSLITGRSPMFWQAQGNRTMRKVEDTINHSLKGFETPGRSQ